MPARFDEYLSQRLAELPPADGGSGGWQAVQAKLRRRSESYVRAQQVARYSMAASVVVLACVLALVFAQRMRPSGTPLAASVQPVAAARPANPVEALRARSVALEQVLAALPERPAVARAGTALPIDTLEAQVLWLDHQLSGGDDLASPLDEEQLWRERVEVMNSLVRLRYAEAQQVAM
jgi:hypothetical protein